MQMKNSSFFKGIACEDKGAAMMAKVTGLFVVLLIIVGLALPVSAAAPPVIIHAEQTEAYSNVALQIMATVTAEAGLDRMEVFFRSQGTKNYYRMLLRGQSFAMSALIPSSLVTGSTLEYYLEARDKDGQVSRIGNATDPIAVNIKKDTTAPDIRLLNPEGDRSFIPLSHNVLVVAFSDKAGNVDPASVRVYWDNNDVTKRAVISPTAISLVIAEELKEGRHYLQVKVADTAGNVSSSPKWQFTARKQVIRQLTVSGGLSGAYKFDSSNNEFAPEWKTSLQIGYGEWGASIDLSSDDPMFTKKPGQPTNKISLTFDGTWLDVNALDLKTTINNLVAKEYAMRGGDISLNTFVGMRLAAGQSAVAVPGESFSRYMVGVRPALNIGRGFTAGLDAAAIWDKYDAQLGVDSKPEYSLGLGADSELKLFGDRVVVGADGAISVYFDNARQWLAVGDATYPIPDPIASPPRLDSALQVAAEMPLPWSKVTAQYKHIGPNYKTLGASVTPDEKGYVVNWESSKWFNALSLGASYSRIDSNVTGPINVGKIAIDLLARYGMDLGGGDDGSAAETGPVETAVKQQAKVKLAPQNWPSLEVKVETTQVTEAPEGASAGQDNTTNSWATDIGNLKLKALGGDLKLGLGYAQASYTDALVPNATKDKVSRNVKVSTNLTKGIITYGTIVAVKTETDLNGPADDLTAMSPSFEGSIEVKPLKSLSLKATGRIDKVTNNAAVASDETDNQKVTFDAGVTWKLGSWLKVAAGAEAINYTDNLDDSKSYDEVKAQVGAAITF